MKKITMKDMYRNDKKSNPKQPSCEKFVSPKKAMVRI